MINNWILPMLVALFSSLAGVALGHLVIAICFALLFGVYQLLEELQ